MSLPALLMLEDGSEFSGVAIGAAGMAVGEVVFNTAMTGYQEILTDPSYSRQLVTLTCAHVGNTGVNGEDEESDRVHASGLIIHELSPMVSSFRSPQALGDFLQSRAVVGIAQVDTRRLTRLLREKGAQAGCILVGTDRAQALAAARAFPGLKGMDLARCVTTATSYQWRQGTWQLHRGLPAERPQEELPYRVVAYDYGVKRNILRMLVDRGCSVTVVPAQTPASEVIALRPDGVFLSNGPGDPEPCDYAVAAIRQLLHQAIPLLGICLGHQLLALACGARTVKMKFGHHGANHPVRDLLRGSVIISSQNHGFTVEQESLPSNVQVTHQSLFDGSLQGMQLTDKPAFSFQGHPEASPGPHDGAALFDHFIELMECYRAGMPYATEQV